MVHLIVSLTLLSPQGEGIRDLVNTLSPQTNPPEDAVDVARAATAEIGTAIQLTNI